MQGEGRGFRSVREGAPCPFSWSFPTAMSCAHLDPGEHSHLLRGDSDEDLNYDPKANAKDRWLHEFYDSEDEKLKAEECQSRQRLRATRRFRYAGWIRGHVRESCPVFHWLPDSNPVIGMSNNAIRGQCPTVTCSLFFSMVTYGWLFVVWYWVLIHDSSGSG